MNTLCIRKPNGKTVSEPQFWRPSLKRHFSSVFGDAFDDLFAPFFADTNGDSVAKFEPRFSIHDRTNEIVIKAEVPGVATEDLDISLTDDGLTIKGEKKQDWEQQEGDTHYIGRSYGSFSRYFPIATPIDLDGASTESKDGVLTITLPKSAAAKDRVRKLQINAH